MDDQKEKQIENILKDILYYVYLYDMAFPRSCGIVSNLFTYFLKDTDLPKEYDIQCVRGLYKNEKNMEWCEDVDDDVDRYHCEGHDFGCVNCGCCEYMNPHSWIELSKAGKVGKTGKTYIIDATQIQFTEDFPDYQEYLTRQGLSKNAVYEFLKDRSEWMILSEHDDEFKNYIPYKKTSLERLKELMSEDGNSYQAMKQNFLYWKHQKKSI